MKKILAFIPLFLFAFVCAFASNYAGTLFNTVAGLTVAAPVVLSTQKVVFITALQEEYVKIDDWLNKVQDLSSFVVDGQTLRFPEAGSLPAVYKNRTTNIDSVEPTETINDVSLDLYDTQNYQMRNINMHALPFKKIEYYMQLSADAIRLNEVADSAYVLAPTSASTAYKRIVIPTTGAARDGLKMMQLADVQTLARRFDALMFPETGRNLVLPSDMWWDLVSNNDILKNQLSYQAANGNINPTIVNYYGFDIHKASNNSRVPFNANTQVKAAQGAVITGDVVPAGFAFCETECFKAGGSFDMYMLNKEQNTAGRADEFGFSHRFMSGHKKNNQRYSALIYCAKSA